MWYDSASAVRDLTNDREHPMSLGLMTADGWQTAKVAAVWGVACLAALQLQELPYDFGHGICGVWGCGPPVQALLACHGFWAVNLATLLWFNHRWLPPNWERGLANLALGIAVVGLIGVAAYQMAFWFPHVSADTRRYVVQRYLFSIAILVDAPLVQLAAFGIAGRWLGGKREVSLAAPDAVPKQQDDGSLQTVA